MTKVERVISWLAGGFEKLQSPLGSVTGLMVFAIFFCLCFEVFARKLFHAPTSWAYDISALIQGCFILGAGYALICKMHTTIVFLSDRLNPKWRDLYLAGISVVASAVTAVIAWLSFDFFHLSFTFQDGPGDVGLVWWPTKMIFFIGWCAFSLQFLIETFKYCRQFKTQR